MRLLLLEDHDLFVLGLKELLKKTYPDLETTTYRSIEEFKLSKESLENYDLLISDIELPGGDIFEVFKEIKSFKIHLPILVLSMHNKLSIILKCQQMGIEGYMLKDENIVLEAVKAVLSGNSFYSPKAVETMAILENKKTPILSPREEEIIKCIAQGQKNAEIAETLFVSLNTVATHRKNINRKLQLSNSADITRYYFENYLK